MAYLIILVILPAFVDISFAKKDSCDLLAAIGIRLTIAPCIYEKLTDTEKLQWFHNETVIYQKDKGKLSVGKPEDVTATGSLILTNPRLTSAGVYQAKVFNMSNSLLKSWSGFVCMMEKVSRPNLTYSCDKTSVNFNCYTDKTPDLRYSWTMDEKILTGESRSTLTVALSKLKSKNTFTCSVSNQVSNEISENIIPVCMSQPASQQDLQCFQTKTVMAVLAGGVSFNLILITVIIALCCCRGRKKSPKHKEKEEPRMMSLRQREHEAEYETMHVLESTQETSPKPSPRVEHSATVKESAAVGDSLQPAAIKQGIDPSPVPKPRTKRPNTPDI